MADISDPAEVARTALPARRHRRLAGRIRLAGVHIAAALLAGLVVTLIFSWHLHGRQRWRALVLNAIVLLTTDGLATAHRRWRDRGASKPDSNDPGIVGHIAEDEP